MALKIDSRPVSRSPREAEVVDVDVCVVGAGSAGISAALEAAKLGKSVVLADSLPTLGGQAVNSIIGTFCGLYSNGPQPHRVTYGVVDDMLDWLAGHDASALRPARNSLIVQYDERTLARWVETRVLESGVQPLLGAVLTDVSRDGDRVRSARFATRYGQVDVRANGWVDASGDAALSWMADFDLHESDTPIYGSQMFTLEGIDEEELGKLSRADVKAMLREKAAERGLLRQDGFVFAFPGHGLALVNMTHVEVPVDALAMSRAGLEGRAQADRLTALLREEFPAALGRARIRSYGQIGVRQTRSIVGAKRIEADEIRQGVRFADAVARCTWPIEVHGSADETYWEEFGDDHMHYVPFSAMTPRGAANLVVAGRCIDADPVALSSVRVMGPCIAMGAAAANALDLAGSGSVAQIDIAALQERVRDNLERADEPSR